MGSHTSYQNLPLESFRWKDGLDTHRDLDETFPEEVVQVITTYFPLPRVRPKDALIVASKLQSRDDTFFVLSVSWREILPHIVGTNIRCDPTYRHVAARIASGAEGASSNVLDVSVLA
jgi:hypothetical protein